MSSAMSDTNPKEDETYSEAETVARREAALKRMLATPHKPHRPKSEAGSPSAQDQDPAS